jgi:hypothetical protein
MRTVAYNSLQSVGGRDISLVLAREAIYGREALD